MDCEQFTYDVRVSVVKFVVARGGTIVHRFVLWPVSPIKLNLCDRTVVSDHQGQEFVYDCAMFVGTITR